MSEVDLSKLTAQRIFNELLPQGMAANPEKAKQEAKKIKATVKFDIGGETGGCWTVDVKSPEPKVIANDPNKADVTIAIDGEQFASLVAGGIDAALKLILKRKIKIRGNAYKATKMGAIFELIENDDVPTQDEVAFEDMDTPRKFMEYAMAFEEAIANDEWDLIKPYFTDDIVYDSNYGPIFGIPHPHGWDNIAKWFHAVTNAADRRTTRAGELYNGPVEVPVTDVPYYDIWNQEIPDKVIRIGWVAFYDIEGAPTCTIYGMEWALYRGDKIFLLRDQIPESSFAEVQDWLDQYGHLIEWDAGKVLAAFEGHERYSMIKELFETSLSEKYQDRTKLFDKDSIYPDGEDVGIMAGQKNM